MAYVIGKKIVKDSDPDFQSYAYGITLPAKRGVNGFFEQGFTSYEQTKSNLRNLLSTKKGERVMQPDFGSGLHSLLFEPMTDTLEEDIQSNVTEVVSFWLPYVRIEQIDIKMTDEMKDRNIAEISISFSVGTNIQTETVTFTIQG